MDTTTGRNTPKLQFSGFFPSADFFADLRRNTGAVGLLQQFNLAEGDHGLERFITALSDLVIWEPAGQRTALSGGVPDHQMGRQNQRGRVFAVDHRKEHPGHLPAEVGDRLMNGGQGGVGEPGGHHVVEADQRDLLRHHPATLLQGA
jgi:hypothetical protein